MHVFDKRILNKGLGTIFTIFQSLLVGIKVASEIQTEQFSAAEFDLFSSCQALNPESTSWRSFDSPIHRKLVKNLHYQKVSVKSVATPWEHTSSRYRTSTRKPTKTAGAHVELSKTACLVKKTVQPSNRKKEKISSTNLVLNHSFSSFMELQSLQSDQHDNPCWSSCNQKASIL